MNNEGLFHRGPRPFIGWSGVALVFVCVVFLIAMACILVVGMWRWANGLPVDLVGFAATLAQATAAGSAVWSLVKKYMDGRTTQRVEEIRANATAPPSFTIPSTSSSGGVEGVPAGPVNEHGGPGAP